MAYVVSTVLAAGEVDPALLKALGEHDDRMEKYLDAHELTVDAVVRDLDGEGKLRHTTVSKLKQRRVAGKLKTKVVSATKDGADELKAEQERADERDAKNERTESPFAPRNQGRYTFKSLGPEKQGSTELLIAFAPGPSADPAVTLDGVAVVDPVAGEVVKLALKPAKLPMFVDSMRMDIEYENRTEAGRNISKFVLAGAGGLLFIKRRGDLTMKFSFE
jgi:hypothetical protein